VSEVATGSCLCGGVRFRIEGALQPVQVCHCTQCRKAQGGPLATNLPVARSSFELLAGADLLTAFESSPGKRRVFCRRCGSPVYSERDSLPDVLRLRAGLLDEPQALRLLAHFHTASRAAWWPIDDDLPRYEGTYVPGGPLDEPKSGG
jgi:hypothetical protein